MGGCLFDIVTKDLRSTRKRFSGRSCGSARADYCEALGLCNDHEYGNGVAIFTRDGDAARDFAAKVQVGMIDVNIPIPVRCPITLSAAGSVRASAISTTWARSIRFTPNQDH